jgi:hypothetical protein
MFTAFGLLTVLLSTASKAAPTTPPPFNHAANFKLVADVTSSDLSPSIQNWELTSYHISPCYDYAVLQDPAAYNNAGGRPFYANGTASEIRFHQGNLLSDGGTPPFPYGFIVPSLNTTDGDGRRAIAINCGAGTNQVGISTFPDPEPKLVSYAYGAGQFYVCNATLPYGPAIQLFVRDFESATPDDCAEVNLIPQCVFDGASHPFGAEVGCYQNVSQVI